jgi:hypothetical protein
LSCGKFAPPPPPPDWEHRGAAGTAATLRRRPATERLSENVINLESSFRRHVVSIVIRMHRT